LRNPSVVHVLWGGRLGGIERLVHDLAAEQSQRGFEVAAAFGQAEGFFADRIRELPLPVIELGLGSGRDLWPRRIAAGARLLSPYDLVHAHGYNLPLDRIMRRSGRAIVFTEHGQFGLGRRLGISGTLKQRLQRSFLVNHCSAVAANSRWTARLVTQTYGIDPDRVTVVHNGIVTGPDLSIELRGDSEGEVVIAYVGQLKAFKRVDRIIRALALTNRPDVRVLIAGSGPLEGSLRALAEELGVTGRVLFLGWTPDVLAVLRQADVIVLPSEGEPFGLAMVEGCAEGLLPVAFSDGGGALECISPDGRVVDSVEELAELFQGIEGSEALSPEARRARAAWAREQFPISRTATAYGDLYQSALKTTPTPSP
jgi:glycosyltransferase involved in cell wall biosynthesis